MMDHPSSFMSLQHLFSGLDCDDATYKMTFNDLDTMKAQQHNNTTREADSKNPSGELFQRLFNQSAAEEPRPPDGRVDAEGLARGNRRGQVQIRTLPSNRKH